jgi:(S)-ureidoglycine-glyoxylate aminotransferase
MDLPVDRWQIDAVSAGLQKCLGGPSGSAPLTVNDRVEKVVARRRHIERGIRTQADYKGEGALIRSNYFDLAMLMDYWSERRLNHHTEATTMLYAARECARILLREGLTNACARHQQASRAMVAGLRAMQLEPYGDLEHKMHNITGVVIPPGVDGERVRTALLDDFNIEIGTSFGPLIGKIWRIGTMGFNCRKDAVLVTLGALETVLAGEGVKMRRGAGVDAARAVYAERD